MSRNRSPETNGRDVLGRDGLETSSSAVREPVESPDGHRCHDHFALLYETVEEQLASVVPFVRRGLENGERCLCVVDELPEGELLAALREAGVEVERALESGALSFPSVEETYLGTDSFDPDEMVEWSVDAIEETTGEYEGLRITAETTWLQADGTAIEDFMAYEAKVNELFADADCVALCQYDRTAFDPAVVRDVVRTHPHLIHEGTACQNFYHTPPEEFFVPDQAGLDVDRMLGTLVERTEAKTALAERERFQRDLVDVTADADRTFGEKLQALFELGCERFDLELGAMARVDGEDDRFEVEAVSDDHAHFEPGVEIPLSEAYCAAAVDVEAAVAVTRPREEGYDGVTVYEEFGIQTYLGTYVAVDDGPDRTFFFVSSERRTGPFADQERTFLESMAQWVQHELERDRRESHLQRHREHADDVLDAIDDVFYVLDEAGTLKRWNETACEVTGCVDEATESTHALEFFDEADHEAVADAITEGFETGRARVEAALRTADGERIPYEFVASALEDPSGDPVLAGVGRDVFERDQRERYLRELYETTTDADLPFETKVRRLLELGGDRFDFEVGFVSRIDDGELEVVDAVGSHERIQPGSTASLGRTYCRQLFPSSEPMGVTDATAEGWADDPAYEKYGLESYFGTTVTTGNEPYGTLCFASRTPRERPYTDAEYTFLELMGQWVSYELERERREAQFAALSEMSRDLMNAETRSEIAERTVEHAEATLDLPLTAVVVYDDETGVLAPVAQTPRADDELPTVAMCEPTSGALWKAFVANETRRLDDVASVAGAGDLTEVVAVPVGSQGLFVTATRAADGFSDAKLDFVATTTATIKSACTRAERERQLQTRERTLEEQNEALARLNRVNDIIRSIDQALVQASTRDEIEEVVCERLAGTGPYELAWIGEHDPVNDEVTPRTWAGTERGYLDGITITADESEANGRGPVGRAIRTREPQVNEVLVDESFEPWRQEALNRGYHACMALPLDYGNSLYGVLVVYAGQPHAFDDLERAVLSELSDTIAYAINAVESKKALVSNEVTELEFVVTDAELEVLNLAREIGVELTLESVVPVAGGDFRLFFTTRGQPASEIFAAAPRLAVTDLQLISERDEGETCLFEARPNERSLVATVIEHGGTPRKVTVTEEAATITVGLASDGAIREFVRMMSTKYPGAELVAQRTHERSSPTYAEFHATVTEALTPRQLEALRTAYFSGYFERPRERTGSEIADAMDITQPTFNHHLRAAHRKLCRRLFEGDPPEL